MRAVVVVNLRNDGRVLSGVPSVSRKSLMASSGLRALGIGGSHGALERKVLRWKEEARLEQEAEEREGEGIVGQMMRWTLMKKRLTMSHLKAKTMRAIHQK